MTQDPRSYLEKTRNIARLTSGDSSDIVNELLPSHFAMYGARRRVQILDQIDAENASSGELELEDMRSAMERADLRQKLGETHERLRKIGR
jgi:hypothetical protein